MLREFRCDFHIHTCLSPCADLDIYPRALVEKCIEERLDVIAVCDHNASENVAYVIKAAKTKPLAVLPGMEITSSEEVHVLALFDNLEGLDRIQEIVYGALAGENNESVFGCQAIVNEEDEVEGFNPRLLIGSTTLSLKEIVSGIHDAGGLAIACHIDRESFSVIGQLGFIPPDISFDALEISSRTGMREARTLFGDLSGYPFIESSDAHRLADIGRGFTKIRMREANTAELKMAFEGLGGRCILE